MMDVLQDLDNSDTLSIDTLALEEIIQEERAQELAELNRLSKRVCHLHTSLLYYRNTKSKVGTACYETWRTLIRKVGGSPDCWRSLGYHLGLAQDDLDYIKNSVKDDPTDIILKIYLQEEKATLDKIVDVFIKLQRYDILKALEAPLCTMASCFKREENKSDTGYDSNSNKTSSQREIISFTKQLTYDLPPALVKNFAHNKKTEKPPNPSYHRPLSKILEKVKNDKPILFLTFTEDGLETALNVKNCIFHWPEEFAVTVITLNDRKDEVLQNPEKFIRDYFEKADYIVPIITAGYFTEIKSHSPASASTTDNLDCKYAGFIYNLIVNHYIHVMGCFNKKVRSVLPRRFDISVLSSISMYPDLMPWTNEEFFDEQFHEFLKDVVNH